MSNQEIYKRTIGFSLRRALWDILSIVLLLALSTLGFFLGEKFFEAGILGLVIGAVIGLILMVIVLRFVSYMLKAGQIAMMTKGIVEGELPENVIAEGKTVVKARFLTVAAYFAITSAIKGIFNQLGRVITRVGEHIGGDTGGTVGSAVSSVLTTVINYLCDCCLGWVFYRSQVNAAKATCEGAVLFFKHGKTLLKNMGRVFGIGLISLLLIGGAFTGAFYAILSTQTQAMSGIYEKVAEYAADSDSKFASLLQNPATIPLVFAVLGGIIIWSVIHSTFIKPFVLTGVLRNYLQSGMIDIPSEESFDILDSKSAKFRKLHSTI